MPVTASVFAVRAILAVTAVSVFAFLLCFPVPPPSFLFGDSIGFAVVFK
jgi:hypothetical protein